MIRGIPKIPMPLLRPHGIGASMSCCETLGWTCAYKNGETLRRTRELLQPTVVGSHTSSDFFSFGRLLFKIVTRTRTVQGRSLGRSSLPPDGKPHS